MNATITAKTRIALLIAPLALLGACGGASAGGDRMDGGRDAGNDGGSDAGTDMSDAGPSDDAQFMTCDAGACAVESCGAGLGLCDPVDDVGCAGATCNIAAGPEIWCMTSLGAAEGASCSVSNDCAPHMACLTLSGGPLTCFLLCCGPGDDARCRNPAIGGRAGLRCAVGPIGGTSIWVCTP